MAGAAQVARGWDAVGGNGDGLGPEEDVMHWASGWFLGMHMLWWVFWIVLIVALFSFTTPVPNLGSAISSRMIGISRSIRGRTTFLP